MMIMPLYLIIYHHITAAVGKIANYPVFIAVQPLRSGIRLPAITDVPLKPAKPEKMLLYGFPA